MRLSLQPFFSLPFLLLIPTTSICESLEEMQRRFAPLLQLTAEIPADAPVIWEYAANLYLSLATSDLRSLLDEIGFTGEEVLPAEKDSAQHFVEWMPLAACAKSQVRMIETRHYTPGTEQLDILYYDEKDETTREAAAKYSGKKIVYLEKIPINPENPDEIDDWQLLARRLKLRCLPTRFHFIEVGSRRYMEFREGADEAFKEP